MTTKLKENKILRCASYVLNSNVRGLDNDDLETR